MMHHLNKVKIILVILFLSISHCASWAQWEVFNSPTNNEGVLSHDNYLFVSGGKGVFRSSDNVVTWEPIINGLHGDTNPPDVKSLNGFVGHIFASVVDWAVYRSSDSGNNWARPKVKIDFLSPVQQNEYLFTAFGSYVIISKDSANTWELTDTSIKEWNTIASCLAKVDTVLFVGCSNGKIFRSFNNGQNWNLINNFHQWPNKLFSINDSTLFVYLPNNVVFRTVDLGEHWDSIYSGIQPKACIVNGNQIFLGGIGGVVLSTNNGDSWKSVNDGVLDGFTVENFAIHKGYLYSSSWRRLLTDFSSVHENPKPIETKISPNPATTFITIETEISSSLGQIEVFDILGRKVMASIIPAGSTSYRFDITELLPGTYLIRISNSMHQFIKE